MRPLCRAAPTLFFLLAAACGRGKLAAGVSDSTFVATMAELNRAMGGSARDSAARSAARAAVLRKHGVTAEQLEDAARALADDPERAAAVWQAIEDRAMRGDSAPPRPGASPPGAIKAPSGTKAPGTTRRP
jgi:hypothetical protein